VNFVIKGGGTGREKQKKKKEKNKGICRAVNFEGILAQQMADAALYYCRTCTLKERPGMTVEILKRER